MPALGALALAACNGDRSSRADLEHRSQALESAPHPVVSYPVGMGSRGPIRDLPTLPPVVGEVRELPRKLLPNREGSVSSGAPDPAVQTETGPGAPTPVGAGWDGIGNRNGVLPPDTTGDIGPNHYVQAVNLSMAVYSRSGALLMGPINVNQLWAGKGGVCETTNDGDPQVLYDHLADRWLVSQFALPNFPSGPFYQCVAVSQTPDPTGAWNLFTYLVSSSKMNDYPKIGVWPDGYYMAVNQFRQSSLRWAGQGVVVFQRDRMLAYHLDNVAPQMIYFDLQAVDPNLGGMLPADLDGPASVPGAPGLFAQIDDNAWGYSPDQIQLWELRASWAAPASSTFSRLTTLGTAAFDASMCGYARNCIPQPGGTKVDALSDRLMQRLQYRKFAAHETLVVNHTVDVNGADRAGVRWYELRRPSGGSWGIHQQGTFSPDASHRWMGSAAMNGRGEIAIGYSISSTTINPSIRATGRLPGDPTGQLTLGETTLLAGGGFQAHASGRWGDYSAMNVDPVDDCTFWYTQEYYKAGATSAGWSTYIAPFRLAGCGCEIDAQCETGPCADDRCVAGVCQSTPLAAGTLCRAAAGVCDVGESCDGASAACPADAVATNGTSCSDGLLCNGAETCQAGQCTAGAPLSCDDGNPCTADGCGAEGCTNVPVANGTGCSDANACTAGDSCQAGVCTAGAPLACNDGSLCTQDGCSPASGCLYTPISCDDSNACTADSCSAAGGCGYTPISCDDGNACTADTCNPASGCGHAWAACGSGDGCCAPGCSAATDPDCGPITVCGNGVCEGGTETCRTCPGDCRCSGRSCGNGCCGDGACTGNESAKNCRIDCGG